MPVAIAKAEDVDAVGRATSREPPEPVRRCSGTCWPIGVLAKVARHYLKTWRAKDFFRVLNSGCRAGYVRLGTADPPQRGPAINGMIAWRLLLMTVLEQQVPGCEPTLLFTDGDLKFVKENAAVICRMGPDSLGEASTQVVTVGGYGVRRHDPPPISELMWEGYDTVTKATLGHLIRAQPAARHGREE